VECVCRKLDRPEIANASLAILALEVALDDQFPILENKKTWIFHTRRSATV
jgi:hypothetical protein